MQHLTSHASSQVSIVRIDGLGAAACARREACLDATLGGLLAARERVTAELLAEVEQQFAARAGEASRERANITWIGGPVLRARVEGPFSIFEALAVGNAACSGK